jgi:hypothetical protein
MNLKVTDYEDTNWPMIVNRSFSDDTDELSCYIKEGSGFKFRPRYQLP